MKRLSTEKTLYLFLLPAILATIETVFFVSILGTSAYYIIEDSIVLKIINSILVIFIYGNAYFLNSEFKKFTICKIIYISIDWLLIIINELSSIIYLSTLYSVLMFVGVISNIPCVLFYYRGFYSLTSNYEKNRIGNVWKKLGIINVSITVVSVVKFILSSFHSTAVLLQHNTLLNFSFSLLLPIVLLTLSIIEIIYIIKTANAFKHSR